MEGELKQQNRGNKEGGEAVGRSVCILKSDKTGVCNAAWARGREEMCV